MWALETNASSPLLSDPSIAMNACVGEPSFPREGVRLCTVEYMQQ